MPPFSTTSGNYSDTEDFPYVPVLTPKVAKSFHDDNSLEQLQADESSTKPEPLTLAKLFSYADGVDVALMVAGTIGALAAGVAQPLQSILWGNALSALNSSGPLPSHDFRHRIGEVALKLTIVGVAVVFCGFLQVAAWSITASRQAKRIRSAYVQAILSKEIGWFDVNEPMQLATRVAESTVMIQEGMGRKVGDGLNFISMVTSGVVIALVKGWELALVLLVFAPLIALTGLLSMRVLVKATQEGIDSYAEAGAVAQESLGNIRTVHMFNAINHFVKKYESALAWSTKAGIKKGFAVGWGTGLMFFTIFCMYAVGMYFGALMIANDRRDNCTGSGCYDGGRVMTVFFTILTGATALGQAGPSVQAITAARTAARDVFDVIDRASEIDPLTETGTKLGSVQGRIQIQDVSFAYPARPDVFVCSKYSLTIEAGETVALVGPSGSGKSTVVSLLERFYDPLSGIIKLDGVDLREFNVQWLRQQVGLVGQEPALFATSIMENIRSGKPGANDAEVIEAAKMANAYDFIMAFPRGFDTDVGERGAQLSGGQKQRIAIARAIIKNPPILLLDEATSALDTESERVVQESLDKLLAQSRRTTIIVAHRLSTVRNADKIAVHRGGLIVELGTHDELMQIENGHYRRLVEVQSTKKTHGDEAHKGGDQSDQLSRSSSVVSVPQHAPSISQAKVTAHDNYIEGSEFGDFGIYQQPSKCKRPTSGVTSLVYTTAFTQSTLD